MSTTIPPTDADTAATGAPPASRRSPDRSGPRARRARPQAEQRPASPSPVQVPAPAHRHLPAWVRRDFARVRPDLGRLLAELEGEELQRLRRRLDEVTGAIANGRFSAAWQYPDVVAEGRRLLEEQRRRRAELRRRTEAREGVRGRIRERLSQADGLLSPEVTARLQRLLGAAADETALTVVESEVARAVAAARVAWSRRRRREIERARARIQQATRSQGPAAAMPTWQEELRRALGSGRGGDGTSASAEAAGPDE